MIDTRCKICDFYYDNAELTEIKDGSGLPKLICYKCFAAISWQIINTAMNIKNKEAENEH